MTQRMTRGPMKIVDAHQHFWKYDPVEYEWIDDRMAALRRDFLPEELRREMAAANVAASVAVQARQTLEETHWLLEMAAANDLVQGVVGWAQVGAPSFAGMLDALRASLKLVGLRHVVQGEPDGFLKGEDFNAGISALRPTGLVYDILIFERQLPEAIAFVDRHPNQVFVLDHIAKPRVAEAVIEPWAANFAELARRENVCCKLSGMVTEADWQSWSVASLRPYIDVALESFGPRRLMAGSDWPVCTVACGYKQWFETLGELLADLSRPEQERIFSRNAIETYRLREPE